ncbi:MAG TPA: glycosyltransferase [Thermoanaerobaculia bacterium]|nr:glycosyltransferase [Thermoanaerobaculia bacterium]
MFQVVVHTPDVVGERMAGPGIRAWHLARELAKHVPVTLVAKTEPHVIPSVSEGPVRAGGTTHAPPRPPGPSLTLGMTCVEHGSDAARQVLRDAAVLIGQPARGFRKRRAAQRIVYDLFDPTVLELRELYGSHPSIRQRVHLAAEWWRLSEALLRADLLMCAARRQREFYERLQSGEAPWIEVPFGIDLEEVRACEKPRDNVVVWGGGLWEWLDPALAVDAIVHLNAEGVRAKLLFLGRARPNRNLVDRRREDRFDDLLARGGEHVSANENWVPYRERLAWIRAGKVAIMLHRRTAEAEYSIRTRLFDAIAAATPIVATEGGFAAELVAREGLGIVVPPEDRGTVVEALRKLLTDDDFHSRCVQRLETLRPAFSWDIVAQPLVAEILKWRTS